MVYHLYCMACALILNLENHWDKSYQDYEMLLVSNFTLLPRWLKGPQDIRYSTMLLSSLKQFLRITLPVIQQSIFGTRAFKFAKLLGTCVQDGNHDCNIKPLNNFFTETTSVI